MPRKRKTWEYVTETAETDKGMSLKDRVHFHMFNPRGAMAVKMANDKIIGEMIAAKAVPSGWDLAYGIFDNFHEKQLRRLNDRKSLETIDVRVSIRQFVENNERVTAKIKEVKGE